MMQQFPPVRHRARRSRPAPVAQERGAQATPPYTSPAGNWTGRAGSAFVGPLTSATPPADAPAAAFERGPSAPPARAAAAALQALSRVGRSVVLYDAGNAVVRQHLSEYRAAMRAALDAHGEIAIAVRPHQLLVAGEVVLEDRDRERSLAFRLYRDGVRGLRLSPQATWDDLQALLEVVAVRYTSVRQQEDDAVTLLRKAELRGIAVEAVEGFTPAEEDPEPELDGAAARARRANPPPGWDTPLHKLPPPGPLHHRPVPPDTLAALAGQEGDAAVNELALGVGRDLLREAARSGWPMPNRDLQAFFADLRDGLLADGRLSSVRRLFDVLAECGADELREELLSRLGDERTLDLVLASVPEEGEDLPPDLIPFLPLLGISPMLARLGPGTGEARRRLLLKIVLTRLPREAEAVLRHLPQLDPQLVRVLTHAVVSRAPERATEVARHLLAQADDALRVEGLNALAASPAALPLRPILDLLADRSEAIRARAAELLAERGEAAAVDPLCRVLESGRALGTTEAEAYGRALAALAPERAAALFSRWLDPKGRFLRGPSPAQRAQQWAAATGTGALPGAEAESALRALAERSDGDLRRHCFRVLALRRRGSGAAR